MTNRYEVEENQYGRRILIDGGGFNLHLHLNLICKALNAYEEKECNHENINPLTCLCLDCGEFRNESQRGII